MTHEPQSTTDESLYAAVLARFTADARTSAAGLHVGVLNGIVHLAGFLPSAADREAAEELARRIPEVRGVVNRIEAPGAPRPARPVNLNLRKNE